MQPLRKAVPGPSWDFRGVDAPGLRDGLVPAGTRWFQKLDAFSCRQSGAVQITLRRLHDNAPIRRGVGLGARARRPWDTNTGQYRLRHADEQGGILRPGTAPHNVAAGIPPATAPRRDAGNITAPAQHPLRSSVFARRDISGRAMFAHARPGAILARPETGSPCRQHGRVRFVTRTQ